MNHEIAYIRQAYKNTHFLTEHYSIIFFVRACKRMVMLRAWFVLRLGWLILLYKAVFHFWILCSIIFFVLSSMYCPSLGCERTPHRVWGKDATSVARSSETQRWVALVLYVRQRFCVAQIEEQALRCNLLYLLHSYEHCFPFCVRIIRPIVNIASCMKFSTRPNIVNQRSTTSTTVCYSNPCRLFRSFIHT